MFGLQRGLWQRLVTLGMDRAWVEALQAGLSNVVQPLLHEGPVKVLTSQQANALELANYKGHGQPGEQSGNAIWVSKGHGVTGNPAPAVWLEDGYVPADTYHTYWQGTFDHYQAGNFPWAFNDDVRVNDVVKYGNAARGSTILRCEFLGSFSGGPGSTAMARAIDGNLQPLTGKRLLDASGNRLAGDGVFQVKDTLGIAGQWGSQGNPCNQSNQRTAKGYVIYMSDLAAGGAAADCATRKDIGGWELLVYRPDLSTSLYGTCSWQAVVKVCCIQGKLVVCTQTIQFTTPVVLGAVDCGGSVMCT